MSNVQREKVMKLLNLPEKYSIELVLALGKPKEAVVIDEINPGKSIKYWRGENRVHHVPNENEGYYSNFTRFLLYLPHQPHTV